MINITTPPQITKIYLVTNCYGDPNKVYIGKTKNTRKSNHKQTFGKDIIYTEIDQVKSLESKDWKHLECFWIEYFRQFGFNIQNKNEGGNGVEFHTEDVREKIKLARKGVGKKKIIQYDLDGNFIKEWDGAICIENELGLKSAAILRDCRKQTGGVFNFIWRFDLNKIDNNFIYSRDRKGQSIIQYNLKGELVKEWDSMIKASKHTNTNKSSIFGCCNGDQETSNNFIWRYKNTPLDFNFELKPNKKILQFNKNGNFIKEWNSIKEIETNLNLYSSGIVMCCKETIKTHGGYIWKYKNK
jgi:hypothetical protein